MEDHMFASEVEVDNDVVFCPIRGLPIIRSQRVRTLPGFHVLSLGAGREALARGYYHAFGQKFPCHDLEHLHQDDRVYICKEDRKAFLNQMSMQYHRYICHELEERKKERKRLRERAAERQARSLAHAAQLQQLQQRQLQAQEAMQGPNETETHEFVNGSSAKRGTSPDAPVASAAAISGADAATQLLATNDPYLGDLAPVHTAIDDPYAIADDPYIETAEPVAMASKEADNSNVSVTQGFCGRLNGMIASTAVADISLTNSSNRLPAGVDDLYGEIKEREAKRQRGPSTYANAIGAIFEDDFDEDE